MTEERKVTIIKEIKYWKENSLLPDQYCDFLLALYSQGQEKYDDDDRKSSPLSLKYIVFLLTDVVLLFLAFFVIYFTQIPFTLQILMVITFAIISFAYYWFSEGSTNIITQSLLVIFLLIVFLVTVYIISYLTQLSSLNYIIVLVNCMVWIVLGYYQKINFLIIAGLIGIILVLLIIFI